MMLIHVSGSSEIDHFYFMREWCLPDAAAACLTSVLFISLTLFRWRIALLTSEDGSLIYHLLKIKGFIRS
jgi:hypothetical protein